MFLAETLCKVNVFNRDFPLINIDVVFNRISLLSSHVTIVLLFYCMESLVVKYGKFVFISKMARPVDSHDGF